MSQEARKELQRQINDISENFFGRPIEMPSKAIGCTEMEDVNKWQIIRAIEAFILSLHLQGGSAGNVDIYDVLIKYLLNENFRAEINAVRARYCQSERLVPLISNACSMAQSHPAIFFAALGTRNQN